MENLSYNNNNNKTIKTFKRLDPILWEHGYNHRYFWKGKILPLKKKKERKNTKSRGTRKNTGQKNIGKKNDFRGKIEKRLKSLRALGKTISLLPQAHRITHYGTLYTGNEVTRNLITRQTQRHRAKTLLEIAR